MSGPARTQELHSRIGDGILVRLLWRADDDHLFVTVADRKENVEFCVEVRDRTRALDVFHHPFAYAAHYGVQASTPWPRVPVTAGVSA